MVSGLAGGVVWSICWEMWYTFSSFQHRRFQAVYWFFKRLEWMCEFKFYGRYRSTQLIRILCASDQNSTTTVRKTVHFAAYQTKQKSSDSHDVTLASLMCRMDKPWWTHFHVFFVTFPTSKQFCLENEESKRRKVIKLCLEPKRYLPVTELCLPWQACRAAFPNIFRL